MKDQDRCDFGVLLIASSTAYLLFCFCYQLPLQTLFESLQDLLRMVLLILTMAAIILVAESGQSGLDD